MEIFFNNKKNREMEKGEFDIWIYFYELKRYQFMKK